MPLAYDEKIEVDAIARQVARKEIEAMDKAMKMEINNLEAEVKDVAAKTINLEMEMKDLKAEIKKGIKKPEEKKKPEKSGVNYFSKK